MTDRELEASRSLAGLWTARLDRDDAGLEQQWSRSTLVGSAVELPGCIQAQGMGDRPTVDTAWTAGLIDLSWYDRPEHARYREADAFASPFFPMPARHYVGPAWFQREVDVPPEWDGRRLEIALEVCHWHLTVWLDGEELGTGESLSVRQTFATPRPVSAGKHTLTLRVDNRPLVNVGLNAHSITDHTQTNWNGVVGEVSLRPVPSARIRQVRVTPDVAGRRAHVAITLEQSVEGGDVAVRVGGRHVELEADGTAETTIDFGTSAGLWDEFEPTLHPLDVEVAVDGRVCDRRHLRVGFREAKTDGRRLLINGRPTFLRGTLDCCIFPKGGHPPTDVAAWRAIFQTCQTWGMNHVRFHSWCPPRAAFEAADELGIYLQVEVCCWPNFGAPIGNGEPVDAWVRREAERILDAYGNHPSFLILAVGNEPSGDRMKPYLSALVREWKRDDPRRLYVAGVGWGVVDEADLAIAIMVADEAGDEQNQTMRIRGQRGWDDGDYGTAARASSVPLLSHEIAQHAALPDVTDPALRERWGDYLRPTMLDIIRDSLERRGLLHLAPAMARASAKLQLACYKEDVEAALRTADMSGFQLLGLQDFPGQGTALVGMLDAFWQEKGFVAAETFRQSCGETVLLARWPRRTFAAGSRLSLPLECRHHGAEPLREVAAHWRLLTSDGVLIDAGSLPVRSIEVGSLAALGSIDCPLPSTTLALSLEVSIGGSANTWSLWTYATPQVTPSERLRVSRRLTDGDLSYVEAGGRLLLLPASADLPDGGVRGTFAPVFWNRLLMHSLPAETLGLLVDRGHPALADFPTEAHADWQWREIVEHARHLPLGDAAVTPIVRAIDDWNTNRSLAMLFECRVGRGRVLVCSADLHDRLDARPAAAHLRACLTRYADGDAFEPAAHLDAAHLRAILAADDEGPLLGRDFGDELTR